ncbi:phosphatidate cytidylyltransferase [Dinoroseobacter shibae DFL 12 = DSM 16493]|jgi:phosphatidate cytidylyltransferase|uniref:Phosphatidate cytidylyltransferase n=1 Tax=Dinoroseobacter shibae (strain DSM 16493 / NCIMB 14021 / DFL 12) TaxID=398580 RepID=A8LLC4_DINSH|nr:phosphatidate cytidylyltransferase [Dinoroseobacter shibae]ABV91934.1 phosphatidate cytidylyltransferase [Dinoroseobacter shibae DFL 12 = DSM 16493]URF46908.1 phosphatidate cytidylyltransferase [Dinoroseobacter shibae]URF51219.1 phosphatidate cytidylyltransferase [Dinoroseobacter shibae]
MTEPTLPFAWEITAIGGLLVLATVIARLLRQRLSPSGENATIENLNARIMAWWAISALVALFSLGGDAGVVTLFGICAFAALREFMTLTAKRTADHWAIAASFFVVLPVQFLLVGLGWYGLYTVFIPVYAFLLLPILSALQGDRTDFLERVAETQWALMICVFCMSHVPALLTLNIPGGEDRMILLLAFLVIVVQSTDVLQYSWSKLIGRRKIAPTLSRTKTWQGMIGGIASATLLGAALYWITPFAPWQAALLACLAATVGFFGTLVMTAIKRDRGVKDWGPMFAGQGGFIDRLDSVLFAAPVFFHVVRFFFHTP